MVFLRSVSPRWLLARCRLRGRGKATLRQNTDKTIWCVFLVHCSSAITKPPLFVIQRYQGRLEQRPSRKLGICEWTQLSWKSKISVKNLSDLEAGISIGTLWHKRLPGDTPWVQVFSVEGKSRGPVLARDSLHVCTSSQHGRPRWKWHE